MADKYIHVIFVHSHMSNGGVETLIVRMSNWLIARGHKVTLLLMNGGSLLDLLDDGVKVIIVGRKTNLFFVPILGRYLIKRIEIDEADIIYSFAPYESFFSSLVYTHGFRKKKPKFLTGIYNLMDFSPDGTTGPRDKIFIEFYNNYLDDKSKVFMSIEAKEGSEKLLNKKVSSWKILPLAIDIDRYKDISRKIDRYNIVSIGRLVDWKTYNLYMIDVVAQLAESGFDVQWHVYGDGPLSQTMKKKVKDKGLESRIRLMGSLPYEELPKVLANAHVFVGMGTSMIEAACCKVPCTTSIAYKSEPVSYGSIYNLPYYACGEEISDLKTSPTVEAIKKIFEMSEPEYLEECELTFQYVQPYSMESLMERFLSMKDDVPENQRISSFPRSIYFKFFLVLLKVRTVQRIKDLFETP